MLNRIREFLAVIPRIRVRITTEPGQPIVKVNILTTKRKRNAALDEWQIKCWVDGKRREEMDYFTSDKMDAIQTEADMHKRWRVQHGQTG